MSGGNVSIKDSEGTIWLTPGSTDKGAMSRDEIVFRRDGSDEWEGTLPPSREWPFHTRILQERPDCNAVLHAHSQTLVAFSVANQVPNTLVSYQAHHLCGVAAMSEYRMPGAGTLADVIAAKIVNHDCVIMENHGIVVCGKTLLECYQKFEALEFCARAIVKARLLGGAQCLLLLSQQDIDEQNRLRQVEMKEWKATLDARPPVTVHECELRSDIVKFIQRAYDRGLIISCIGTFGARISKTQFLVTPSKLDRKSLSIDDILLVDTSKKPAKVYGKLFLQPSREWKLLARIFHGCPEINSIFLAEPINFGAFCMTDVDFPTTIHPETYLVCQDVGRITFQESMDYAKVVKYFRHGHKALIMNNKGALVVGESIQKAYDMFEICESTTNVVLDTKALGGFNLMTDEQVAELDKHYFGITNPEEKKLSLVPGTPQFLKRKQSLRRNISIDGHHLASVDELEEIKKRGSFFKQHRFMYGNQHSPTTTVTNGNGSSTNASRNQIPLPPPPPSPRTAYASSDDEDDFIQNWIPATN